MSKHPAIGEFQALLRAEGGDWASAKRAAFVRICEAFSDEEGLPPASGLRQLERGHFNTRLEGQWRAIFIDAYRQWLGFRMERDWKDPAAPLSLSWWFTAPAFARGAGAGLAMRLLTPVSALGLLLGLCTLVALGPALNARSRERKLNLAIAAVQAEQEQVVIVENEASSWLDGGSTRALETLLANTPTLRQAEASLLAERERLTALLASID